MASFVDLLARERTRLEADSSPDHTILGAGAGTVRFVVICNDSSADIVLNRAVTVLSIISRASFSQWPDLGEWLKLLPDWFISHFASEDETKYDDKWLAWWDSLSEDERQKEMASQTWTLDNWLFWLEPSNRQWFWWGGEIVDSGRLLIAVEVLGWPFPWDALKGLFLFAGACDVVPET